MKTTIGIIGIGVVGKSLKYYFTSLSITSSILCYDKYKPDECSCSIAEMVDKAELIFICLPTLVNKDSQTYDLSSLHEILQVLEERTFVSGPVILRSTVLPGTTDELQRKFPTLFLYHMPEFLSSKTALKDVRTVSINPIYIGMSETSPISVFNQVYSFLVQHFPGRIIWGMKAKETEAIKLFCNTFYALKLKLFQKFYRICQKENINFDLVRQGMIQQQWIHPSHTFVPGQENNVVTEGVCLPKDLEIFLSHYVDETDLLSTSSSFK
jgi:UDP-glucose 6-dehydrogenase